MGKLIELEGLMASTAVFCRLIQSTGVVETAYRPDRKLDHQEEAYKPRQNSFAFLLSEGRDPLRGFDEEDEDILGVRMAEPVVWP
jgi:hypothetical protein